MAQDKTDMQVTNDEREPIQQLRDGVELEGLVARRIDGGDPKTGMVRVEIMGTGTEIDLPGDTPMWRINQVDAKSIIAEDGE